MTIKKNKTKNRQPEDPSETSDSSLSEDEDRKKRKGTEKKKKKKERKAYTDDDDTSTNSQELGRNESTATRQKEKCHLTYKPCSLKDKYAIQPTLHGYRKTMDICSYRVRYCGSHMSSYQKSLVNNRKKKLTVEMESYIFNPTDRYRSWILYRHFDERLTTLKSPRAPICFCSPNL